MSAQSPAVVLYDSNGTALQVYNNTAVPASTPAILFAGFDGYNSVSRYALMGAQGNLGVSQTSNNVSVFNNGTITASGNDIFSLQYFGNQQINLIVNVTAAPTGTTPTLTFTIQEVDPGDVITVFGSSANTGSITGTGVFTAVLTTTHSSAVKVSWTITGATASFTGVYATITCKSTPDTQVVSGTVTATNSSVGTDGAAALGFDTQVGGKVTTAAPTYTNGNLDALSLTTAGALRVDGSGVTQPVSGTVTANQGTSPWVTSVSGTVAVTQSTSPWVVSGTGGAFDNRSVGADAAAALGFDTQVGGKVTTAAPTYTTGNLDALSLTTSGGLRIDGVYPAGTATASAPDIAVAGGYVTTAAPSYTTAQTNALSLDTSGNLRVTGFVTTNKASTSAITSVAGSTSNTTILAANANRVFASIYNGTNKNMYVLLSASAASTTTYSILLITGSYWEVPNDWTGGIQAVWASGVSGNALITELTP